MGLSDGGHLTHGSTVNFSGKIYQSVTYGVDHETGLINYNKLNDLAVKHNPKNYYWRIFSLFEIN